MLRLYALVVAAACVPLAHGAFDKDLFADLKLGDLFKADAFDFSKIADVGKKGKKAKKCPCDKAVALVCDNIRESISGDINGPISGPLPCNGQSIEVDSVNLPMNLGNVPPGTNPTQSFVAIFNLTGCDALVDDLATNDFSAKIAIGNELSPATTVEIGENGQVIALLAGGWGAVEQVNLPAESSAYPLDLTATLEFDTADCDVLTATGTLTVSGINSVDVGR
uniref:Uncharacterized protein n=1 Tax=Chromera velia CCMP2878 TaxID=1169474 RepID=A0A0G4HCN0_9ALVE|mmetsp:Transcript_7921/g.15417  ORF Transcript_7921/g.15417 Transcript_7921/m.15417 type:complete len:223 (-) Transcript_7921:745-1413(-)|eukprot:Cvel_26207.t1-p1 / transcript=Cvel_26207.t1 / gene=Cvel_26207 / organism=Chromera_velia_CCMP2878 / gene_product=hypothetical protein / transcript_product=hypothetical protein / location=Cvel_scaffold3086:1947-2612(-) / protein_length=222 / sequence_SO=supercontig / SO=protein_coding / is_pseudo=false